MLFERKSRASGHLHSFAAEFASPMHGKCSECGGKFVTYWVSDIWLCTIRLQIRLSKVIELLKLAIAFPASISRSQLAHRFKSGAGLI